LKKAKLGELELLATNTRTHNSLQHLGICLIENWFCIWDIWQIEIGLNLTPNLIVPERQAKKPLSHNFTNNTNS
jgi:hypothetical protein